MRLAVLKIVIIALITMITLKTQSFAGEYRLGVPSHLPNISESKNRATTHYSFVVIGHIRGEEDNKPFFLLDELIAEVARLKPDMVFLTGDMIFGEWHKTQVDASLITAHWERLDAALSQLEAPIYRVVGNHDINDPVTRDIYVARYGAPPQAVTYGNSRFLLLSSAYIPKGDAPPKTPRPYSRMPDLPSSQVEFIQHELTNADQYAHIFLFMHHIVWWASDRAWWRQVHPLLAKQNVRAVFAGDFGPSKFSYLRRDGIDYYHSALSGWVPANRLRTPLGRVINFQFDNFLHVTVQNGQVHVDVKVLGARTSGKYNPAYWDEVFTIKSPPPLSWRQQIKQALGGRQRRAALAALLLGAFAMGGLTVWLWARRIA